MIPTPRNITEELNKYIIGQDEAKKAVAVALSNRERRRKLDPEIRKEVMPKNIILIGPTGVGKTEIARRIAALVNAPFVKVEATKFTEVGYVGRDVDTIIAELVETNVSRTYEDKVREVEARAETLATERLVTYVCQQLAPRKSGTAIRAKKKAAEMQAATKGGAPIPAKRTKQIVARLLQNKELDDQLIEIDVSDDDSGPYHDFPVGPEYDDMRDDYVEVGDNLRTGNAQKRRRKVSVKEARRILTREEASKLIDFNQLVEHSLREVEENGVVFLDELDKLVGPRIDIGRDVSGEGVQRDLLPLVEGSSVMTRYGTVKTDHILFIAAGCFYQSKPSDLIPELQGRFPLRVELNALTEPDLVRILVEPKNSLIRQYKALLATEGVEIDFTDDGVREIARLATVMNSRSDNIGARRLNTIVEKILEELNFSAPERKGEKVTVDAAYVSKHVGELVKDENLSKYIL
ncbi:MAG: ATP-dependent protease ATPase subunit HslU [Dehalococcoidia bacterium]|nr:ATP-dependent protease ATPase subunit HslU [Dehalococcoidia bacterium]